MVVVRTSLPTHTLPLDERNGTKAHTLESRDGLGDTFARKSDTHDQRPETWAVVWVSLSDLLSNVEYHGRS